MIRVGLIGYGFAGRTFHAPLIEATPGLALSAIASSRPDEVHAARPHMTVHQDPDALIGAVDLVVVASPNASHAAWATAALKAGKHVVVEKPFALDAAQAADMVAQAERSGKLLSVFHNRRWDSDFLTLRAAIEADTIGRVTHFESHFDRFRPVVRARWREQALPGGGIWYDLGPHLVDQALQLFGAPDGVTADLAALRSGSEADDWAHVVLQYPGRRVVLHASMLVAGGSPRFVAHGDKGSLVKRGADRQEAQLIAGLAPGDDAWGEDPDPLEVWTGGPSPDLVPARRGCQQQFYSQVGQAIRGEAPNPTPHGETLAVMRVLDAARESAARRVTTPS